MSQKKYNPAIVSELKEGLEKGITTRAYLNKSQFVPTRDLFHFEEEMGFREISENTAIKILVEKSDFERGKMLYESLSHLSRRDASDIGFWNYLSHNQLYKVVHRMWPDIEKPPSKSSSETYILNHWIMTSSAQSELMDYPLSGLWWSFFLTVDEGRADKYELTKVFFKNLTFRTKSFGQSKIARHKEAVIGVLEFIIENGLDQQNFEDNGNAITPYLNLLGGVKPLGAFDRDWFKEKLNKKFRGDIEKYGRLFRRTERPKSETQVYISSIEDNLDQKGKTFIAIWEDGLQLSNSRMIGVKHQLELDFSLQDHALFIAMENGYVKKINREILKDLSFGEKKPFTPKLPSPIQSVFYVELDSLLLACFKNSLNRKSLKVFDGDLINGQRINGLFKQINNRTRELKIIPISKAYRFQVPSLIKNYPEGAFPLDDFLVKDEIDVLRPIIEENKIFN
jgi:hypothetical protein